MPFSAAFALGKLAETGELPLNIITAELILETQWNFVTRFGLLPSPLFSSFSRTRKPILGRLLLLQSETWPSMVSIIQYNRNGNQFVCIEKLQNDIQNIIPAYMKLLKDQDLDVRSAAASALGIFSVQGDIKPDVSDTWLIQPHSATLWRSSRHRSINHYTARWSRCGFSSNFCLYTREFGSKWYVTVILLWKLLIQICSRASRLNQSRYSIVDQVTQRPTFRRSICGFFNHRKNC